MPGYRHEVFTQWLVHKLGARHCDIIEIEIPGIKLNVNLSDKELTKQREEEKKKGNMAFKPAGRDRKITGALRAYATRVSSADRGAIRII